MAVRQVCTSETIWRWSCRGFFWHNFIISRHERCMILMLSPGPGRCPSGWGRSSPSPGLTWARAGGRGAHLPGRRGSSPRPTWRRSRGRGRRTAGPSPPAWPRPRYPRTMARDQVLSLARLQWYRFKTSGWLQVRGRGKLPPATPSTAGPPSTPRPPRMIGRTPGATARRSRRPSSSSRTGTLMWVALVTCGRTFRCCNTQCSWTVTKRKKNFYTQNQFQRVSVTIVYWYLM